MADIFDQVALASAGNTGGDIFDQVAPQNEGTLTKLARMPKEAVAQVPYVGKAASYLVPDTPGQWAHWQV